MRRKIIGGVLLLTVCGLAGLILLYNGILWFNMPRQSQYPVRGVDVSNHQGEIDWAVLSDENIQFAFIKATEGSTFVDPYFAQNWRDASETDLLIGGYHFFSFDSAGETQAENIIAILPRESGSLPPVVDVEFYGGYDLDPPDYGQVTAELHTLLTLLEAHYGVPPILYSTYEAYTEYLAGEFTAYPLWIRDIFRKPDLPDGVDWTFWQYSNRGRLAGYAGEERYIDLNVFSGSLEALNDLLIP